MNTTQPFHVLIVEDDQAIAELERDYLEASGYRVTLQHEGTGVIPLVEGEDAPDCVLLDVMLPGRDGFSILRELRAITRIPVIMVTARQEDIDTVRGLGLGADDYVSKPFSPQQLVARVGAHIARYRALTMDTATAPAGQRDALLLHVGTITLDPASHRVWRGTEEIILTAREFAVLELLMAHPDRVFSRDELYDRIWGEESWGDQSTVTVHIRRIREKIEADPSHPALIQTVRGVGYRLGIGESRTSSR